MINNSFTSNAPYHSNYVMVDDQCIPADQYWRKVSDNPQRDLLLKILASGELEDEQLIDEIVKQMALLDQQASGVTVTWSANSLG